MRSSICSRNGVRGRSHTSWSGYLPNRASPSGCGCRDMAPPTSLLPMRDAIQQIKNGVGGYNGLKSAVEQTVFFWTHPIGSLEQYGEQEPWGAYKVDDFEDTVGEALRDGLTTHNQY